MQAPVERESVASIAAIGAVSGFAAGLLGIGGGAVSVVGLTAWARFSQHEAHAISLACIPAVAVVGAIVFAIDGSIAYLPGSILIAGAFAGVLLGARFMLLVLGTGQHVAEGTSLLVIVHWWPSSLMGTYSGGSTRSSRSVSPIDSSNHRTRPSQKELDKP